MISFLSTLGSKYSFCVTWPHSSPVLHYCKTSPSCPRDLCFWKLSTTFADCEHQPLKEILRFDSIHSQHPGCMPFPEKKCRCDCRENHKVLWPGWPMDLKDILGGQLQDESWTAPPHIRDRVHWDVLENMALLSLTGERTHLIVVVKNNKSWGCLRDLCTLHKHQAWKEHGEKEVAITTDLLITLIS